jgi:hypothetical protein
LFLVSFYAYSVRSSIVGVATGDIILRDQSYMRQEFVNINNEAFSNIINLPAGNCTGTVNYCAVVYKSGVNAKADMNGDGIIDVTDAEILDKAFGCQIGQTCWNQPIEQCYFTLSGRKFKDPTRDCKFDSNDTALITDNMGNTDTLAGKSGCDDNDACKADINQDGVVNILDSIIASDLMGKNADTFVRLANSMSQADINGDGKVDMSDAILLGNNYNQNAIEQRCFNTPLTYISGNQYGVNIPTMKAPYYISVTYSCS